MESHRFVKQNLVTLAFLFKESHGSSAMKEALQTLRFCRYVAGRFHHPVQALLNPHPALCIAGCRASRHGGGHGHVSRRAGGKVRTDRGSHRAGGDGRQKPPQTGAEASAGGTRAALQPPSQAGETG